MATKSANIMDPIQRITIADGHTDILVDLSESSGIWLKNSMNDENYLDFSSFYASAPLGFNHPKLINDKELMEKLKYASINKISNSDFYTQELVDFTETFREIGMPDRYDDAFFISGGALAVENALKASFDWKVRKNFQKGYEGEQGSQVLHFEEAFHGRSGYTLSLTNTADPRKHQYFPKFNWPRVNNPKITFPMEDHIEEIREAEDQAIDEIQEAFNQNKDDIAAIIIEPIQGEGGDNHFRQEFLHELRLIADDRDAMLVFDEVQTGVGLTGEFYAYQHFHGAEPDMIAFGKKMQVCGFFANDRIHEVENNVFKESSRINSTWGGNIVDMVRSTKYMQIIDEDNLVKNAKKKGKYLQKRLKQLSNQFEDLITNVRGRGLMVAFDLPTKQIRDNIKEELKKKKALVLSCGVKSIRFRPPLIVENDHIDLMMERLEEVLKERN